MEVRDLQLQCALECVRSSRIEFLGTLWIRLSGYWLFAETYSSMERGPRVRRLAVLLKLCFIKLVDIYGMQMSERNDSTFPKMLI